MDLTVPIPDDFVPFLNADRAELERRALEALALSAYRRGTIDKSDLGRMLGLETSQETDSFLKERNAI